MKKILLFLICCFPAIQCIGQTGTRGNSGKSEERIPVDETENTGLDEEKQGLQEFTIVEEMPLYKGGDAGLMKFLSTNIHYPDSAKKYGIEGVVYLSFVVEKDASTGRHKVVRGANPYLDEEALRVCRLLQYERAGRQKGKPVPVQFTLPVRFKLN